MAAVDLAAFESADFDVKVWVNEVLSAPLEAADAPEALRPGLLPTPQEQLVQQLVGRLQGLEEELNDGVERCMRGTAERLPTLLHEVERLEGSITACEADMRHLSLATDPAGPGDAAETTEESEAVLLLAQMEAAQERMAICLSSLKETARWHDLLRVVSASVATAGDTADVAPDLATAVDALEDMAACADTLKVLPGAADRAKTLTQLREDFEKVLAPQVAAALSRGDAGRLELRPFVAVYRKIGRVPVLRQAYCKALPKQLHKQWYAFAPGRDALQPWMADFHASVRRWWAEEKSHAVALFQEEAARTDALEVALLREAISQLWEPLTPNFRQRLAGAVAPHGTALLVDVYDDSLMSHVALFEGQPEAAREAWPALEAGFADLLESYPALEAACLASEAAALLAGTLQRGASANADDADIFAQEPGANGLDDNVPNGLRRLCSAARAPTSRALARARRFDAGSLVAVAAATDEAGVAMLWRGAATALREATAAGVAQSADERNPWAGLSEALAALAAAGAIQQTTLEIAEEVKAALAPLQHELLGRHGAHSSTELEPAEDLRRTLAVQRIQTGRKRAELAAALGNLGSQGALPESRAAAGDAAEAACSFVFGAAFGGIRRITQNVHGLACWGDQDEEDEGGFGGGPGASMTAVSDQLFNVLQCIENWCESEAAMEALRAMEATEWEGRGEWSCAAVGAAWDDLALTLSVGDAEKEALATVIRGGRGGVRLGKSDGFEKVGEEEESAGDADPDADAGPRNAAWICNAWLHVLGSGVVSQIASQVLMVPRFTAKGSAQLAMDTSYLINVFEGLGIEAHPLLHHLHYLAAADNDQLQQRLNQQVAGKGPSKLMRRFDGALGRARGLAMPMEKQ